MATNTPTVSGDPLALLGRTLDARYRVDGLVSDGGFSVVYQAYDKRTQTNVALKVLKAPMDTADGDEAKRLAQREFASLFELAKYPISVVRPLDLGVLRLTAASWASYIVMELLEGAALDQILNIDREAGKLRPLAAAEAVTLLETAAQALATAHDIGIAHSDIKPSNLFLLDLPNRYVVKVLDFGIAKRFARDATTGTAVSGAFTLEYAAPEQFDEGTFGKVTPATDVFAFALVVVELMTTTPALDGQTHAHLMHSSMNRDRRPTPRSKRLNVTDELEAVFVKALAVDPRARYQTMRDFWTDLTRAAGPAPSSFSWPAKPIAEGAYAGRSLTTTPPRRPALGRRMLVAVALVTVAAAGAYRFSRAPSKLVAEGTTPVARPVATPASTPPPLATGLTPCGSGAPCKAGPSYFAAIDLGTKGVKAFFFKLVRTEDGMRGVPVFQADAVSTLASGATNNRFAPQSISEAARAAAVLVGRMKQFASERLLDPAYLIVGSSGIATFDNRDELAAAVDQATGLHMQFVDATTEGRQGLLGVVHTSKLASALLVDIGSGNMKMGCMVEGVYNAVDIPFGTVTLTQVVPASAPFLPGLQTFMKEKIEPEYTAARRKVPCLEGRPFIYFIGGTPWAAATFTHPEQTYCRLVRITARDLDDFKERLETGNWRRVQDARQVCEAAPDDKATPNSERERVQDRFTQENLIAGVALMRLVLARGNPNATAVYFRNGDYIYGYALEHYKDIQYETEDHGSVKK